MKREPLNFSFQITGLIVAVILISVMATTLSLMQVGMEQAYNISGNTSLANYTKTQAILSYIEDVNQSTQIQQDKGILDVIGGYFSAGFAAIKIALGSFDLFNGLMDQAAADIPFFAAFKIFIVSIIFIGLLLLAIRVIVKWEI